VVATQFLGASCLQPSVRKDEVVFMSHLHMQAIFSIRVCAAVAPKLIDLSFLLKPRDLLYCSGLNLHTKYLPVLVLTKSFIV